MRRLHFLLAGVLFLTAIVLGACSTVPADHTAPPGAGMSKDLGDKAFYYHQQAVELWNLAKRLEIEAEWYAQQAGPDSEQAKRSREMAKAMWATAEEADRQAREYQSQLPHARVY